MPSRTLLVIAILIVAATFPFLLAPPKSRDGNAVGSNTPISSTKLTALWDKVSGASEPPRAEVLRQAPTLLAQNQKLLASTPVNSLELAGLPGVALADALRFDITPAWVNSTWPRVTPQRMETGWYGVRVPLVTGTQEEDITGSLTYYFNAENYVERISLIGSTGDAEPLTSFVQQNYHLQPLSAAGRGLFVSYFNQIPIGLLKVEDAHVQTQGSDRRQRYHVRLELNLPRAGASLSLELMEKLRKLNGIRPNLTADPA